ncbi:hypothetical protein GCM10010343_34320 [Streptomyces avidinii]|nr:hypothetical protein GCM10010343_34320 [Streptomyces avidinii]
MPPAGPQARHAVLAGPGRPAPDDDTDVPLVPTHPQTGGELWTPPAPAACRVPLPFGVWLWLTRPEPYLPVPASGAPPDGVLRDDCDPPAPGPRHPFRVDAGNAPAHPGAATERPQPVAGCRRCGVQPGRSWTLVNPKSPQSVG